MSERSLSGETLAKFDALESMKTVRRKLLPEDDLTVDSAGLAAVHTPLKEHAVHFEQALGSQRNGGAVEEPATASLTATQRVRPWTEDPARLWLVGLLCVIAVGLLTFVALMLTNSL